MRRRAHGRYPRGGNPGGGAGRKLRAPSRQRRVLTTGEARPPRPVALLTGEPAGTLAPRVAGAAEFRATLAWRGPEDVPRETALVQPPGPARFSLLQSEGPNPATRHLSGEVRALSRTDLGAALEAVLRAVTTFATLTEATLEVSAVSALPPRVASPRALEGLARDLWEAGFPVRFAPSWTPSPQADVYLGAGGGGDLFEFVRAHPAWSLA